eukprot:1962563-Amphidinium_carterae.1
MKPSSRFVTSVCYNITSEVLSTTLGSESIRSRSIPFAVQEVPAVQDAESARSGFAGKAKGTPVKEAKWDDQGACGVHTRPSLTMQQLLDHAKDQNHSIMALEAVVKNQATLLRAKTAMVPEQVQDQAQECDEEQEVLDCNILRDASQLQDVAGVKQASLLKQQETRTYELGQNLQEATSKIEESEERVRSAQKKIEALTKVQDDARATLEHALFEVHELGV